MKFRENDEVTGTLLDSDNMVGEVEQILENPNTLPPELQYDSKKDPEYNEAEMREAFWSSYMTNGVKLTEAFRIANCIKDYLENGGNPDDVQALADSLPDTEKSAVYYKTHIDELEKQFNAYKAKNAIKAAPEAPRPVFDKANLTNDLAKDLMSDEGDEIDAVMSAKDSAEDKFENIYTIAKTIFQGRGIKHHAFIYGDPGVGKTFSVKLAMQKEFPKGALAAKGYSIEWNSGDIGNAKSNIVAFFYKNRQNKIIVLDDCDSFIRAKDQALQNLLKGMLDLDNTEKNPKYITTAASIRKLASKILQSEANARKEEGIEMSIDQKKLREGILSFSINGEEVLNEAISPEEAKQFKITKTKKVRESKDTFAENYFGLGVLNESNEDEDEDEWADEESLTDEDLELAEELNQADEDFVDDDDTVIPEKWRFTSRLIMISNLTKKDVNDAVLSRTLSYELTLTQDEFLARLSQILPNLLTDVETESSADLVEYAKEAAYAHLLAACDIAKNGGSFRGKPVIIDQKLQFRIIAELAGKWMQRADNYAEKMGISVNDRLSLDRIANEIKKNFFYFDVIPSLRA